MKLKLELTCKRFDKPVEVSVEGLAHYANKHNQQTGRLLVSDVYVMLRNDGLLCAFADLPKG